MLGGPGGDDNDANKRLANSQVRSSFIQFLVAVGLINLGREDFLREGLHISFFSTICSRSGYG